MNEAQDTKALNERERADLVLGVIPGPVWPDHCEHPPGSYIASYETFYRPGVSQQVDLYVFEGRIHESPGICLRDGPRGQDYHSPRLIDLFARTGIEPYATAMRILLARGYMTWWPHPAQTYAASAAATALTPGVAVIEGEE